MLERFMWLLLLVETAQGAKILFYHDTGTGSHMQLYFPLVEELLNRGHTVTGAYYASAKLKHDNYTEVLFPNELLYEVFRRSSKTYFEEGASERLLMGPTASIKALQEGVAPFFEVYVWQLLANKELHALLKQNFDLVISTSWQSSFVAELTDSPLIFLSTMGPATHFYFEAIGNEFRSSTWEVASNSLLHPEHFTERLTNMVAYYLIEVGIAANFKHVWMPHLKQFNHTGDLSRDVWKTRGQLVLSNSHAIFHDPVPCLENVIHVGGLHIKPTKPLPPSLNTFMDNAKQGAVLVSFGSMIPPSLMTTETKQIFLDAFKELNVPIIWKWDEPMDDAPANVLIQKWVPQQDLLAHPNLKAFVTHGGLLSVMEAIYHETALVGIPFANDQRPNILRLESKQLAVHVSFDALTTSVLVQAIQTAMQDRDMRGAVEEASQLFKDVKEKPLDKAVWWIEYVLRHGGDVSFLKPRSTDRLTFYERQNLDIYLALLVGFIVSTYVTVKIFTLMVRCCCYGGGWISKAKQE